MGCRRWAAAPPSTCANSLPDEAPAWFLSPSCALLGGATPDFPAVSAWSDVPPRRYARTQLVDIHGTPVRAATLAADTNYVFQYPYAATPCFLLKLGRRAAAASALRRQDGNTYAWQGGVGPGGNLVAFSAICAHKLAYPTRDVSFIRFQRDPSATTGGSVIHCCADHSVYDPGRRPRARGRRSGAPQPLAAIVLEHPTRRARRDLRRRDAGARAVRRVLRQVRNEARARIRQQGARRRRGHVGRARARAVLPHDDPLLTSVLRRAITTAAATRRPSSTRMLNVRHAARVSIISTPMRMSVSGASTRGDRNRCVAPVPTSTISGLCARRAAKSSAPSARPSPACQLRSRGTNRLRQQRRRPSRDIRRRPRESSRDRSR